MAQAALTRVDFRLIHGQVATYWIKQYNIKRILIVDDEIKNDEFMQMIFDMAKPQGVAVEYWSMVEAGKAWADGALGIKEANDATMILFKTVNNALAAYQAGMKFTALNIGNMVSGPGRISINSMFFIGPDEARIINEMADSGVAVTLHAMGGAKASKWESIRSKYFPNV